MTDMWLIVLRKTCLPFFQISRQQRAQTSVELRKNKRDEHLNKRRNVPISSYNDEVDEAGDRPQLNDIVINASSENAETQLAAVTSAR